MKRYYVEDYSRWYGKKYIYNKDRIKKIIKEHGGRNIRYATKFYDYTSKGHLRVVCFNGSKDIFEKVQKALNKALEIPFPIIINEKVW